MTSRCAPSQICRFEKISIPAPPSDYYASRFWSICIFEYASAVPLVVIGRIACLCVIVYFAVVVCISFHDVAHSATQTFNSGWPSLWTACSILQRLVGSLGPWGYVPVRQSTATSSAIPDSDGGDHSSQSFSLPWPSLWEAIVNSHVHVGHVQRRPARHSRHHIPHDK